MTKTKKIIIFIIISAVLAVILWWFFGRGSTNNGGGGSTSGFSIRNFFPFGQAPESSTENTGNNLPTSNNSQNKNEIFGSAPLAKLRKLSDKPVAGAVIYNQTKSTTSIVRFVEKATGNVYEAYSNSPDIKRLTNETIPKIMRAIWLPDGSGFLAQTTDESDIIETSFIKLKLSASTSSENLTPYEAVISKLPIGILEISPSPDGKKIFYYTADNFSHGFISNPDGTAKSEIFTNYLTEWLPSWFASNSILMASKASGGAESFGFILDIANKNLKEVYNNVSGGTGLARGDGKYILLGNAGDNLNLSLESLSTGTSTSVDIASLPEKCAWNPADLKFIFCAVPKSINSANPLDKWHQGALSTNDIMEKINVFDLYKYVLSDPENEVKEQIDAENLEAPKSGDFVIFTNKTDQSLWILDAR